MNEDATVMSIEYRSPITKGILYSFATYGLGVATAVSITLLDLSMVILFGCLLLFASCCGGCCVFPAVCAQDSRVPISLGTVMILSTILAAVCPFMGMWNLRHYFHLEEGHVYQNVSTTLSPSSLHAPTAIVFTSGTFLGSSSSSTIEVMIEPDETTMDETVVAWKYAVRPYLEHEGQDSTCYWAEANTALDAWGSDGFSGDIHPECGCVCGGVPIDLHQVQNQNFNAPGKDFLLNLLKAEMQRTGIEPCDKVLFLTVSCYQKGSSDGDLEAVYEWICGGLGCIMALQLCHCAFIVCDRFCEDCIETTLEGDMALTQTASWADQSTYSATSSGQPQLEYM